MEELKSWEELSYKEQMQEIFSDVYKDAHGVRPRHINVYAMSGAELEDELRSLYTIIEERERIRVADQQRAIVRFGKRVEELIKAGAGDRKTAIRWMHDAEGTDGDDEYLCWTLGLPYGFLKNAA